MGFRKENHLETDSLQDSFSELLEVRLVRIVVIGLEVAKTSEVLG